MQHSSNTSWLDVGIQEDSKFALVDHDRLEQVLAELPCPNTQFPQLCVFLGSGFRERVLQSLFPWNNIRRHKSSANIDLRCDIGSANSKRPILFADGGILPPSKPTPLIPGIGYTAAWDCKSHEDLWVVLCARLLFALADAVCLLIDGESEIDSLVNFLVSCTKLKHPSISFSVYPRIIIAYRAGFNHQASIEAIYKERQKKLGVDLDLVFAKIHFLDLNESLNPHARYDHLKRLLIEQLDIAGEIRDDGVGRPNGKHLTALFQAALRHTMTDLDKPFDYIRAIRIERPLSPMADSYLSNYLESAISAKLNVEELVPPIASAMVMDHYVPGTMMSSPQLVFRRIYRSVVLGGYRKLGSSNIRHLPESYAGMIESEMASMFDRLKNIGCSSVDLRKNQMSAQSGRLSSLRSTRICVYCILRPAQHMLACGHTLCDLCAQVFGIPGELEYQFIVQECLCCHYQRPMIIDVLPPTMKPSVLAIDGGGVRGVIPLEYLLLLQEHLAPCAIQDLVDLAIGTSSGGLIVLGLFKMGWNIKQCSQKFEELARVIFHERRRSRWLWGFCQGNSILGGIGRWVHWILHDSCYDTSAFDSALKAAFGKYRRFFGIGRDDPKGPLRSSSKVGVIATSISKDTSAFVIGNFNANQDSESNLNYEIIRPLEIEYEPTVWKAARATAAAPFFFTPADLQGIGSFQDGGLKYNFPGEVAWDICQRIWPQNKGSARILSLGTGRSEVSNLSTPHFRHVFRDSFIRRGFDAWMSTMESERDSRRLEARLTAIDMGSYNRLNVPLSGVPDTIDAVEAMDDYRNLVITQPGSARMARESATMLLISRFYLVFSALPKNTKIPFWCNGQIRCKGVAEDIIAALQKIHPEGLTLISDSGIIEKFGELSKLCTSCKAYCQRVKILVRHIDHPMNIFFQSATKKRWSLGGFPASVGSLTSRQGLRAAFGQSTHGCPWKVLCPDCDANAHPRGGRKRRCGSNSYERAPIKRRCVEAGYTGI